MPNIETGQDKSADSMFAFLFLPSITLIDYSGAGDAAVGGGGGSSSSTARSAPTTRLSSWFKMLKVAQAEDCRVCVCVWVCE